MSCNLCRNFVTPLQQNLYESLPCVRCTEMSLSRNIVEPTSTFATTIRATCVATKLRRKLQEILPRGTASALHLPIYRPHQLARGSTATDYYKSVRFSSAPLFYLLNWAKLTLCARLIGTCKLYLNDYTNRPVVVVLLKQPSRTFRRPSDICHI